ncbi:sulfurtransferase [Leptospira wolffii]|uniref:sulfurtransferase n=1 Tax=Leptospira wolffii TaxID=409998 RepID=UPI0010825A53|nr:sulfurtransferase [Leptospira wolffii]TGL49548.1 sulfurtransferase [Leptospira wolffii]
MKGFRLSKIGVGFLAVIFVLQCTNAPEYITPAQKLSLPGASVVVYDIDRLTSVSNNDYDDNRYGLITASTLESWRSNWIANRPAGITGRLVIFQVSGTTSTSGYNVRSLSSDIRVYPLPEAYNYFGETRNNGVIDTETIVPQGSTVNAFLKKFGVNPGADLIVFAQDTASDGNLMQTLRGWYTLYYWGVDISHLAVLNGAVYDKINNGDILGASIYTQETSSGYSPIEGLLSDHTIIHATIADVFNAISGTTNPTFKNSTPAPVGGTFFLDARTSAEYNGTGTTAGPSNRTCTSSSPGCYVPYEGHIKGAVNIPFTNFLNSNKEFLPKADLINLLAVNGYTSEKTIVTYCRTNVRSSITGFATLAILGYPTRFYDGSWVEWGSLAYDSSSTWSNVSSVSFWRTDKTNYTDSITQNVGKNVGGTITSSNITNISLDFTQNYAAGANAIIDADKKFLAGSASSGGGSSGGGGGGGGNPCGG